MSKSKYVPCRGDVVWLDFDPTTGKEIGKIRPALILSSKEYALSKGLVICCPITTSMRGGAEEVPISGLDKKAAVVSSIVHTYSWTGKKIEFIKKAVPKLTKEVFLRLIIFQGAEDFLG
jgi:mRNA interferase MazF